METTDYCSYELSKALKACGFDEPCDHYYVYDEESKIKHLLISASPSEWDWNYSALPESVHPECSAPSLYHAQKWLREGAMLHVGAYPAVPALKWYFYIDDLNQHVNPHNGELITRWDEDMQEEACDEMYGSYESALSAGISAALELIEQENK